ncbi:MAG: hypothetical protein Q8Q91_03140 [Candidatus Daviesbacteria bacterium]|nr:hypothetical protein [Candidatus Daviesbacteria bacterium]
MVEAGEQSKIIRLTWREGFKIIRHPPMDSSLHVIPLRPSQLYWRRARNDGAWEFMGAILAFQRRFSVLIRPKQEVCAEHGE